MKVDVYTNKGIKSKASVEVADLVFAQKMNRDLLHQVVVSAQSNLRQNLAHTKDRSEVRGGGKKPWRQKGTGNARHGSRRSPIWRTGGVTFGPRNDQNFAKKINRKMKIQALYVALSAKFNNAQVLFVEDMPLTEISTKFANEMLVNLEKAKGFETLNTRSNRSNVLVVLPEASDIVYKSLRNLPHVDVTDARTLNTLDVMNHRYVVVVDPAKSSEVLEKRHYTQKSKVATPKKKEAVTA